MRDEYDFSNAVQGAAVQSSGPVARTPMTSEVVAAVLDAAQTIDLVPDRVATSQCGNATYVYFFSERKLEGGSSARSAYVVVEDCGDIAACRDDRSGGARDEVDYQELRWIDGGIEGLGEVLAGFQTFLRIG